MKTFFFGERLRLCPWSLALASSIPVLGLERFCPRKGCPWPRTFFVYLALASSLVSSTPPLSTIFDLSMGQGHEQYCFVLEHDRELAKKKFEKHIFRRTLRFCGKLSNFCGCFFENISALCLWSLSIPGLGLGFFVSLAMVSSLVSSTPPLILRV